MMCMLAGSGWLPGVSAAAVPAFGAQRSVRYPCLVTTARTGAGRLRAYELSRPYHGDWAIDFVDTDRSTRDPLYAVAPGIVHIEAQTGNNTCAMSCGTSCRPTRTPILA